MADSQSPEKRSAQRSTAVVHVFVFVGGIALYLLLGLVLWWALNRYIDPQTPTQKRDVVQILAVIMAGVAGAVGIYFTWRGQGIAREGQQISRENIEVTRESTEEQVRLTQEGQSTERYTRALDQLGATDGNGMKRLEIRLGAIYELGQISRVSQVLREPILQVLTAYIREHAPAEQLGDEPNGRVRPPSSDDFDAFSYIEGVRPPTSDIQAILDVLRRREEERVPKERRVTLNLRRANLQIADLQGANLQGADLREANFLEANLYATDLRGANLQDAKVSDEQLDDALSLRGATMPDGRKY